MYFDDLNPPMKSDRKGDAFFGCLIWVLMLGGLFALLKWVF